MLYHRCYQIGCAVYQYVRHLCQKPQKAQACVPEQSESGYGDFYEHWITEASATGTYTQPEVAPALYLAKSAYGEGLFSRTDIPAHSIISSCILSGMMRILEARCLTMTIAELQACQRVYMKINDHNFRWQALTPWTLANLHTFRANYYAADQVAATTNTKFVRLQGTWYLVALRDIPRDTELSRLYGIAYWQQHIILNYVFASIRALDIFTTWVQTTPNNTYIEQAGSQYTLNLCYNVKRALLWDAIWQNV